MILSCKQAGCKERLTSQPRLRSAQLPRSLLLTCTTPAWQAACSP